MEPISKEDEAKLIAEQVKIEFPKPTVTKLRDFSNCPFSCAKGTCGKSCAWYVDSPDISACVVKAFYLEMVRMGTCNE
jgi:aerobic-type carbon monoxide dehydrogenase small subunit (CoxS/CutS family)